MCTETQKVENVTDDDVDDCEREWRKLLATMEWEKCEYIELILCFESISWQAMCNACFI